MNFPTLSLCGVFQIKGNWAMLSLWSVFLGQPYRSHALFSTRGLGPASKSCGDPLRAPCSESSVSWDTGAESSLCGPFVLRCPIGCCQSDRRVPETTGPLVPTPRVAGALCAGGSRSCPTHVLRKNAFSSLRLNIFYPEVAE